MVRLAALLGLISHKNNGSGIKQKKHIFLFATFQNINLCNK